MASLSLWAEVPMDLDSPFLKVALVKGKTGEVETREIQQARLVADGVEMKKVDGGVAILPVEDVVAILPLLPKADGPYTAEQAEGAIHLYQKASPELLQKAGIASTGTQNWEKLKERLLEIKSQKEKEERRNKEAQEAETKANLTKEVQDWVAQASDYRASRPEKELTELKQKGEALARKSPGQMEVILQALAALSQVQPKEKGEPLPELSKLNEVQPRLIPDDLLGWLAGGVLILSFFGLLFGLAFLSSSLTRFKEGALLGGIVFGIVALGLLGVLVWTWLPAQVIGEAVPSRAEPKMEELGIYLKNRAKPVYYFPAKQFSFSAEEWRSGVLGYLPVSEESVGLFKVKLKEGKLRLMEGKWTWQQPLTALGIPLPFQLTFEGQTPELQSWENPEITSVFLGRWKLANLLAEPLKESALSIWRKGLSLAGLAGVNLQKEESGIISVTVPAAGRRPNYELPKLEDKKGVSDTTLSRYKKNISSEELARAIADRKGSDFKDKFVLISGEVYSVGGSNFSSVGKFGRDQLKEIYLIGLRDFYGKERHLLVKCLVKGDIIFHLDNRGDLYMRYIRQEYEQDKKNKKSEVSQTKELIKFETIDGIEVSTPDIDTAKELPFIYRGQMLVFLAQQRVELRADEIKENVSSGGLTGRPPGTSASGDIELYGLVIPHGAKIQNFIKPNSD